jgi:hypothetical protein
MRAYEALRRRGFFLHSSDSNEPDTGEHENPEGFRVRVRTSRSSISRQLSRTGRFAGSRSADNRSDEHEGLPEIRSGSVTGSRQRSHLPR